MATHLDLSTYGRSLGRNPSNSTHLASIYGHECRHIEAELVVSQSLAMTQLRTRTLNA